VVLRSCCMAVAAITAAYNTTHALWDGVCVLCCHLVTRRLQGVPSHGCCVIYAQMRTHAQAQCIAYHLHHQHELHGRMHWLLVCGDHVTLSDVDIIRAPYVAR
jgi:hypothetical protein